MREEAYVELIIGGLGGGKTYRAVRKAMDTILPHGGIIFANVQLVFDEVAAYVESKYSVKIVPEQLVFLGSDIQKYSTLLKRGTSQAKNLLLYDESHLDLTSVDYKANRAAKKSELELITQARKLDIHCIFITQDEGDIDVYLRRRAQFLTNCTNWQKLPFIGGIFRLLRLPLHTFMTYHMQGGAVSKNSKPTKDWHFRDLRICKSYDTKALFGKFQGMESETFTLKSTNTDMKPSTLKLSSFLVVGALLGTLAGRSLFASEPQYIYLDKPATEDNTTGKKIPGQEADILTLEEEQPEITSLYNIGRKMYVRFRDGTEFTHQNGVEQINADGAVINGVQYYLAQPSILEIPLEKKVEPKRAPEKQERPTPFNFSA